MDDDEGNPDSHIASHARDMGINIVTGKLSRGVKISINNLTGTEIEIDQGRRGLTWFETDAYTDVTLKNIERKTHATKGKKYCFIHVNSFLIIMTNPRNIIKEHQLKKIILTSW